MNLPPDQDAESRETPGVTRYNAFISYRHCEPDRRWAKWLHRALETYRPPRALVRSGVPARIRRVFRDEDELPASADLSRAIDEALEQSRYLIVVCSPRTLESRWVNQEIVRFREMGRGDRILALLVEGEPGEAFPLALREIRTRITGEGGATREEIEHVEPLAVDVRASRTERPAELERMARLRLAACILGCRFDDLRQRDQERHRRRLFAASAVLAGLVVSFGVLALWAFNERDRAERERAATIEALGRARHAGLLNASRAAQPGDPMLALLLARAAAVQQATPAAVTRLHEVLAASSTRRVLRAGERLDGAILDPTGRFVLGCSWRGGATVWDLDGGSAISLDAPGARLAPGAFSPDGMWVVTTGDAVRMWRLGDGHATLEWTQPVEHRLAAVSPDGRHLVTGGAFDAPILWMQDGRRVAALQAEGETAPARETVDVAWAPEGEVVAIARADGVVQLWTSAGVQETALRHEYVRDVAFSQVGHVLTRGGNQAMVWSRDGEALHTVVLGGVEDDIRHVSFSPSGDSVLTTFGDGRARLWPLPRTRVEEAPTPTVFSVANAELQGAWVTPDGRRVVATCSDGTLRVWDRRGATRGVFAGMPPLFARDGVIGFLEAGRRVVFLAGDVHVWSLQGEEVAVLRVPEDWNGQDAQVLEATFTPDGRDVLTHSLTVSSGDTAARWRLSGEPIAAVTSQRVLAVAPELLLVREENELRLIGWDGTTTAVLETKGRPPVVAAALSPAGDRVVTVSHDGTLEVWDGRGELLSTSTTYARHGVTLAFAPDGRHFAAGAGRTEFGALTIWTRDGVEVAAGSGHDAYVCGLAFSPDGTLLASASFDETAVLSSSTGEPLQRLVGHEGIVNSVALSSDGRLVLTTSADGTARLWNRQGEVVAVLEGHAGEILDGDVSPAGDRIVTASADGTARLWSLDGEEQAVLAGHRGGVRGARFSPDGRYVVTAGQDGTARVFLVYVEDVLELARSRSTRGFTPEERARFAELLGD